MYDRDAMFKSDFTTNIEAQLQLLFVAHEDRSPLRLHLARLTTVVAFVLGTAAVASLWTNVGVGPALASMWALPLFVAGAVALVERLAIGLRHR